jgi:hypothetical protein
MNKDQAFRKWYDERLGTKNEGFAYDVWCAAWDIAYKAGVLAEREACAQLCDDASLYFIDQGMNAVDGADYCANEIRGRTE